MSINNYNPKKLVPKETRHSEYNCHFCGYNFSNNSNLKRHIKAKICSQLDNKQSMEKMEMKIMELEKKIVELKEKDIAELKEKPSINNQILQVVCIGDNDNYLDMLTKEWNNFHKALEYIKDCALSSLTGDCKLINKIYFDEKSNPQQPSIRFLDANRNKIEYLNEKNQMVRDSKECFGRKLANNLQNSYLKGVNYLIAQNIENHRCPNKFLEEYDLQTWNQHIYDLSDYRYQRKIVNQLSIPLTNRGSGYHSIDRI
jgi:hypothetical protein